MTHIPPRNVTSPIEVMETRVIIEPAIARLAARTPRYPAASRNSGVQPMMKKSARL